MCAGPPGEAAATCRDSRGPHSEAETEQRKVTEHTLKQDYLPHATAKHSEALQVALEPNQEISWSLDFHRVN